MLEIEQQFPFSPEQLSALHDLFPISTKKNLDETYFDFPDFSLLKNDTWLRQRNTAYELKYRKPENQHQQLEIYDEVVDQIQIKQFLGISDELELGEWISEHLQPIIHIRTTRHTFKQSPLTIDVDLTDFGYAVCEIEYAGQSSPEEAQRKILQLAQQLKLETTPVKNKAKAFVEQNYPELNLELKELGVL